MARVNLNLDDFKRILNKTEFDAVDIAWAAGLFEGEGTVYWENNQKRIRAAIHMTDEDVIVKFQSVLGFGRVYGPYKLSGNRKIQWQWQTQSKEEVYALYHLLSPFLCERRQKQFLDTFNARKDSLNQLYENSICYRIMGKRYIELSTSERKEYFRRIYYFHKNGQNKC